MKIRDITLFKKKILKKKLEFKNELRAAIINDYVNGIAEKYNALHKV